MPNQQPQQELSLGHHGSQALPGPVDQGGKAFNGMHWLAC